MELSEIIKQQAQFARNSRAVVETDSSFSWVSICDSTGHSEEIFMQGDEADDFIAQCESMQAQCPELDMETIELATAWPFIENIWS